MVSRSTIVVASVLLCACVHLSLAVTSSQLRLAQKACNKIVKSKIPGFVRLSFHDCVGGCDGCLNLNNPDNNGLADHLFKADKEWKKNKIDRFMSRADFIAVCGVEALKEGHRRARNNDKFPNIKLKFGRRDCDGGPTSNAQNQFPNAKLGLNHAVRFFREVFGLKPNQYVALIGAHTLGRAKPSNSGYKNTWVDKDVFLDNEFYIDLLNAGLGWVQEDVADNPSDPRWQWVHSTGGGDHLMLNTDMCIAIDINPSSEGRVDVSYSEAGREMRVKAQVDRYAASNQAWLNDFAPAFEKMIHAGL